MPDHLGKDQRKTKDDNEDEKPIQSEYMSIQGLKMKFCFFCIVLTHKPFKELKEI